MNHSTQPTPNQRTQEPRIGELERLGPDGAHILVLGLEAPDFNELPADRKVFAYYLYRAAIAGNDIMYAQNHRHAIEIKELLEAIYLHSQGIDPALQRVTHDYLKYFWIHHGNYDHYTHTKFVPNGLTSAGLRKAAGIALADGAPINLRDKETLDDKLDRIERTIFYGDYEPMQSNAVDGVDMVATSAVNFWDADLTQADLDALSDEWTTKLNVRFASRAGKAVPEVFKIGGVFSEELKTIVYFLELALSHAEDDGQRRSIELLIEYYRTGDEEVFRQHSIEWLKSNTTVDYLNGFIEQYIDPRGIIGNFEGNVSYAADTRLADRFADNALYFEQRMPWPDKYKRTRVDRPVAKVVNVLVETGDAGPISPAAYNLPNYNDIRRDHGSKNVMFLNIERTSSRRILETITDEFYLPEYRENVLKYAQKTVRPLEVYMHEIIGHGSGQSDPSLTADPRTILGRVYSPLEECRSDLVALYHMADPKLVEIGALEADEQRAIVETTYVTYTQGWMVRYDRIAGQKVREAHNKGHQLILMYLVENGGDATRDFGIKVIDRNGNFFVKIDDIDAVREGVRELLCKLQVIKSTGDAAGAAALFDRFGTDVNPAWHENMLSRLGKLKIPKIKAFVFPHLVPVLENGHVVDVRATNDEDLTTQQLRFSRFQGVKDIAEC